MDLPWDKSNKFFTNVGLITTNGPHGHNIMAAEWTHQVSYKPGLIMVNIGPQKATVSNIEKSKEFGVSLAADDQSVLSSVAGGSSGSGIDKIKVAEGMGFEFYKAKKIDALMVKGASMNIECKLVKKITLGDHIAFIGGVVDFTEHEKDALIYYGKKYWKVGEHVQKPAQPVLDRIGELVEKNKK